MLYYGVLLLLWLSVTCVALRANPRGSAFAIGAALILPDALRGIAPSLPLSIPERYLSETVYRLPDGQLWAWASFAVYASWYGVPFAAAAVVRWAPLGWASVGLTMAIGFTLTGLMPLSPPWMETGRTFGSLPGVSDFLASDPYPHAAFPSMHVALPVAIGLADARTAGRRSWLLYAGLISVVVVVTGEHWLLDVIAAWVLAVVVRMGVDVYVSSGVPWSAGERQDIHDVSDGGGVAQAQPGETDLQHV